MAATRSAAINAVSLLLVLFITSTSVSSSQTQPSSNFIATSCKSTTYQDLCVKTLSVFATKIQQSPRQLTQTALAVSLSAAQSAKNYVAAVTKQRGLKHRELEALRDCMEEMSDTVDRLTKSFSEMKRVGKSKGQDFQWHMSNVETWVSAALTDENTCVDGFAGKALDGKVKATIKARCVTVAQVTSNALALVNRYASRQ